MQQKTCTSNKKVLKIWLWTGKRKISTLNFVTNKGKKMIVEKIKTNLNIDKFINKSIMKIKS